MHGSGHKDHITCSWCRLYTGHCTGLVRTQGLYLVCISLPDLWKHQTQSHRRLSGIMCERMDPWPEIESLFLYTEWSLWASASWCPWWAWWWSPSASASPPPWSASDPTWHVWDARHSWSASWPAQWRTTPGSTSEWPAVRLWGLIILVLFRFGVYIPKFIRDLGNRWRLWQSSQCSKIF